MAEPFPESEVKKAWDRAGGRCECKRSNHSHSGRCNRTLKWESRGKESESGWEAHHIDKRPSHCEQLRDPVPTMSQGYENVRSGIVAGQ